MNLRIQHSPIEKPLAFLGDRLSCLSDARLDYLDRELDFQNPDQPDFSSDWIAFLSVERPDNARSVNGDLMNSVRCDAVEMATFFVGDFLRLFYLAHNYRIPLKTMGEAYAGLSHSEKRALQQESSRVILCLFLGRSKPLVAFVALFGLPRKADQGGGKQPRCVADQACDQDFNHSIRSRIAPVSATIAGDIAPHGVTGTSFNESRGGVESRHTSDCIGQKAERRIGDCSPVPAQYECLAGVAPSPRDLSLNSSQPFAMSGQLASDDFIVVARSLIQRAYSLRSNQIKDPTTDRTEALPGIVGLSAFRFGPHDEQSIMRGSASGQKSFAKGASHV